MYWDADRESGSEERGVVRPSSTSEGVDYANPNTYYSSAPPVKWPQTTDSGQTGAYTGPASLEGYTVDAGEAQRAAAEHSSVEAEDTGSGRKIFKRGGILATLGALLLNLKWFPFVLKFGVAGFSAVISIVAYSFLFGWPFAVGIVALLFVHEMGHALVMKLKGMPIGGMVFIPLLGAAVLMKRMPSNAKDEAEVGIAGPLAGALGASVCFLIAQSQPGSIWAPLAYFGFFINLFNLIPVLPFDGGRILAAVDRRIWIIGFIGLLGFQIWSWIQGSSSFWLLLFIFMAGSQIWMRRSDSEDTLGYYTVSKGTRILIGLLYFGLAAVLVLGMNMAHQLMMDSLILR